MLKIISGSTKSKIEDFDCTYEFPENEKSPYEQLEWIKEKIDLYMQHKLNLTIKTFSPYIINYLKVAIIKYNLTNDDVTIEYWNDDNSVSNLLLKNEKNELIIDTFNFTEPMSKILNEYLLYKETKYPIIAYKGMKSNMTCKGFQYEIGKTYKTDKVKLCECEFHAYLNPQDVLDYYEQDEDTRYFKVKLSGEITKCKEFNTKVAATKITILEEITDIFDEVIETTEWWKNNNVLDLLYYSEGFAVIQRGGKLYNFIDKQGNILSNEWFDYVWHFQDGFAVVQREDGLWNFIDKQGNYLSEEWFYHVSNFCEGFAAVERGDELCNFIDKNRNYLFDEWFNDIFPFYEGLAAVQRSDKLWNFIDKNRNYLSDEWFNYLGNFQEGFAVVERSDGLYNFIDKQGNILSNEWFYNVAYSFEDGFANVYRTNGEFCKIDKTGKLHEL